MSCNCSHIKEKDEKTICPCDGFLHPLPLSLGAGLKDLPREIGGFPEFRRALLRSHSTQPSLQGWHARENEDLGVMLLEMWAYLCDSLSFYDKVIAQETYLNTASLRTSVRKLVALLGYQPAPATASIVKIAALADGRTPIILPVGTAFRSSGFNGNPPQVFELTTAAVIHPFNNKWQIPAVPVTTIQHPDPSALLVLARTEITPFSRLLLLDRGDPEQHQVVKVSAVRSYTGADGKQYTEVRFQAPTRLRAGTPLERLWLLAPDTHSILWSIGMVLEEKNEYSLALLEKGVKAHDLLDDYDWGGIDAGRFSNTILRAAFQKPKADPVELALRFGVPTAGIIVAEPKTALSPRDPMSFDTRTEAPRENGDAESFALVDKDQRGALIRGSIDYTNAKLRLGMGEGWTPDLIIPVTVYGNMVEASRGETVRNELLGSGNASVGGQRFRLGKKPLTYLLSPTADNDRGVENTLRVYVNGVRWKEVGSFFGIGPEEEVYIVRQDDEEESYVLFGDGVRGKRLPSGTDNVVAYYRYGAGKAAPPAGTITQIGTPVPGLDSIRNPTAAVGGADAERREKIRMHAPRSALILGRAVSILDMEAVSLATPGVRSVQAEWHWHGKSQSPVILIWYIGEEGIEALLSGRLRSLSDPSTPIRVEGALSIPVTLTIDLVIDPAYLENNVLSLVRKKLTDPDEGLLNPENVGIGKPLFRSRIFEQVLSIAGVQSAQNILWNGEAFSAYSKKPPAGAWFNFEKGEIILNGT